MTDWKVTLDLSVHFLPYPSFPDVIVSQAPPGAARSHPKVPISIKHRQALLSGWISLNEPALGHRESWPWVVMIPAACTHSGRISIWGHYWCKVEGKVKCLSVKWCLTLRTTFLHTLYPYVVIYLKSHYSHYSAIPSTLPLNPPAPPPQSSLVLPGWCAIYVFLPNWPHLSLSVHSSCPCTSSCRNAECTLYKFLPKDLHICKLTAVNVVDVEERAERPRHRKFMTDEIWEERDSFPLTRDDTFCNFSSFVHHQPESNSLFTTVK